MPKRNHRAKLDPVTDVVVKKQQESTQPPRKHKKLFVTCGVLILFGVILVVAFLFVSQDFANKYLEEGKQKFDDHLYTEANQDFIFASTLSLFSSKKSSEAYVYQARIADLRNTPTQAAENYRKAIQKKSSDDLRLKYAEQLFILHNFTEANNQLSQIKNPSDNALLLLAKIALRQHDFQGAETYFEELSETLQKDTYLAYLALRNHGSEFLVLYPENGNEDLKKYAAKALETKSYSAVDNVTLGNFLLQAGEPDFALDFASAALGLENNYRDAFTLQAQAHAARRQYEDAQKSLDQAFLISPLSNDLWYIQAQIYEAQDSQTEALMSYKKARELGQDSAEFHFAFAKIARESEDFDLTLEEAKRALTLDPNTFRIYLEFIFWTAIYANNYQEAKLAATEFTTKAPQEEFGKLALAYAQFQLQEIFDLNDVIAETQAANPTSAFAKYLEGITISSSVSAKRIFTEAIDYDTDPGSRGEIARQAKLSLGAL